MPHRSSWRARLLHGAGDISAAVTGALVTLPTSIGYGLILFGPLGPEAFQPGLLAVLVAVILGGAVVGLLGGTPSLAVGGSSSVALLLAALVVGAPAPPGVDPVAHALALVMASTLLAGLLLALLARAGAGRMAQLMPYPVMAGIMNGTAVLMVLSMARHALGDSPGGYDEDWDPGALLVAGVVMLVLLAPLRLPPWLRAVPRVLLAVLAGTLLHNLLLGLVGPGFVGPELGPLPPAEAALQDWREALAALPGLDRQVLALQVLPVAASVAVLAMLETLACVSALADTTARPADSRRDLVANALATLVSGAAAGIAPAGSVSSSMAMLRAGAASRAALPLRSLLLLAGCLTFREEIGAVPMAALAGVVVAGALRLVDLAALRPALEALRGGAQHRGDIVGSAVVMLAVTAIAVKWSLLVAVATGLLLALGVFAASMARDVVRRVYPNPVGRSRIRRPEAETELLITEGWRIAVVELEGAIFFGSADHILGRVHEALRIGARYIILDMRRVSRIDHSGARRLLRGCNQFWREGHHVSLAYVRPGMAVWDYLTELRLMREMREEHVFASLDAAVEVAESALLAELGIKPGHALSPEEGLRSLRVPEPLIAPLLGHMRRVSIAPGQLLIRAGDPAGEVWLLLAGLLDVTLPLAGARSENQLSTRLATLAPGALVGEMALLSGQPRSADVVARTPVEALCFEVATMERLRRDAPDLAWHLLAGVTLQSQQNLRQANVTISGLEE